MCLRFFSACPPCSLPAVLFSPAASARSALLSCGLACPWVLALDCEGPSCCEADASSPSPSAWCAGGCEVGAAAEASGARAELTAAAKGLVRVAKGARAAIDRLGAVREMLARKLLLAICRPGSASACLGRVRWSACYLSGNSTSRADMQHAW